MMRSVKKEEVEKQIGEILELMQQIEEKIDHMIDDFVQEQCEHKQAQIRKLEEQIDTVEQKMDKGAEQKIFVPSKLHFV